MQPGMPQGFGTAGPSGIAVFMLPGNPASASVSLCLFVAPPLDAQQGLSPEPPATARAILTSPVQSAPDKRSFLTGILAARARIAGAECPDGLARSAAVIVTRGARRA